MEALHMISIDYQLREQFSLSARKYLESNNSPDLCSEKYWKFVQNCYKSSVPINTLIDKVGDLDATTYSSSDVLTIARKIVLNHEAGISPLFLYVDVTKIAGDDSSYDNLRIFLDLMSPFSFIRLVYVDQHGNFREANDFGVALFALSGLGHSLDKDYLIGEVITFPRIEWLNNTSFNLLTQNNEIIPVDIILNEKMDLILNVEADDRMPAIISSMFEAAGMRIQNISVEVGV
jgi:hypothetical protein